MKPIFVNSAGSEYVSMGGRDAEMTFGIGSITYTELYGSARTIFCDLCEARCAVGGGSVVLEVIYAAKGRTNERVKVAIAIGIHEGNVAA